MYEYKENMQWLCLKLLEVLQCTRALGDIEGLYYDPEKETVTAQFPGGRKVVNVAGDSGIAMIRDVLSHII